MLFLCKFLMLQMFIKSMQPEYCILTHHRDTKLFVPLTHLLLSEFDRHVWYILITWYPYNCMVWPFIVSVAIYFPSENYNCYLVISYLLICVQVIFKMLKMKQHLVLSVLRLCSRCPQLFLIMDCIQSSYIHPLFINPDMP